MNNVTGYVSPGPFRTFLLVYTICISVLLVAADEEISDACHGNYVPQCTNVLKCDGQLTICIYEVRFYQWHLDDGCNFITSGPVDPGCCEHNDTRCYKTLNEQGTRELQEECTNNTEGNQCELPAGVQTQVAPTCSIAIGGVTVSSVRSIRYTCELGICPEYQRSTQIASTAPISTQDGANMGSTSELGTGEKVGIALGSIIIICAIVAVVLFAIFKLRSKKDDGPVKGKTSTDKTSACMDTKTNPIFDGRSNQNEYDNPVFLNADPPTSEPEYVTIIDDNALNPAPCNNTSSSTVKPAHLRPTKGGWHTNVSENVRMYNHLKRYNDDTDNGDSYYEDVNY